MRDILRDAKFGDRFRSDDDGIYVYVDKRARLVPCENKRFDVLYFARLGDCLDYNEFGIVEGLTYLRYDDYDDTFQYYRNLIEKL